MSRKWQETRRRDDEVFPSWAWPAKKLLRAFSSISLAVVLLGFVGLYAVLASVPIGLLATIPTYLLVAITLLAPLAVVAIVVLVGTGRFLSGISRANRFVIRFVLLIALGTGVVYVWANYAYPPMRYDPGTGTGMMLFADFVEKYDATTMRRLPAFEMTELEFYAWWPLKLALLAFVLNLITATVRRIEFKFVNIGVLSVHTGIVLIALGSLYYSGGKLEGDTLLRAGEVDQSTGIPAPGPIETWFYDNIDVALWIEQGRGLEQRRLTGVPRYNDYLDVDLEETVRAKAGQFDSVHPNGRGLNVRVPASLAPGQRSDTDIHYRLVGYAGFAEPVQDWTRVDLSTRQGVPASFALNPARFIEFVDASGDLPNVLGESVPFFFLPRRPADRGMSSDSFGIEYTINADQHRWSDLGTPFPEPANHALIVEVPALGDREAFRAVYPVTGTEPIVVGETGYTLSVTEVRPQPPFPIITPGYENASSSMTIVHVDAPDGEGYQRWIYHRFPEISQDMLDAPAEGMPGRRPADPKIKITYLDASRVFLFIDERPDGTVRALVRAPGGEVRAHDNIAPDARFPLVDRIDIQLTERWEHVEPVRRPSIIPPEQRQRDAFGTHQFAMLAIEVTLDNSDWSTIVWAPFSQYSTLQPPDAPVMLPDGRQLRLGFGRLAHRFPDFGVQLVDFEIVQYDHRGAPRDYRSQLRVVPTTGKFPSYDHIAKLNAPLTAPHYWSQERLMVTNLAGRLAAGLKRTQFKLSQSGWDREGWNRTQSLTDSGMMQRPFASFTILGVGNAPGIHVVALGGVLMAMGTPWAFYVKPALLRRRKKQIQQQLASQAEARPNPAPKPELAGAEA